MAADAVLDRRAHRIRDFCQACPPQRGHRENDRIRSNAPRTGEERIHCG
jgi:hypothetical protein